MNNKNKNKTTTFKILLMLSIISMMLIPEGIISVYAAPGDLLLTINNPTPEENDSFGYSVAATPDGNILVGASLDNTGATATGAAYLFDTNGDLLLTINNPRPDYQDYFGISVASTPDGNILVGAAYDNTGGTAMGAVYLFDGTNGDLLLTINNPTSTHDYFGYSVASTPDGNIVVGAYFDRTGALYAGSVYLFDGTNGDLLLTINNPIPSIGDYFGISVASTPDGNILVGAHNDDTGAERTGSAYLFDGTNGDLLLTINNPIPSVDDRFGHSVASTPDGNILVGTDGDDPGGFFDAGSAYLFDGTNGDLLLTINNPTPESNEYFGLSVASTPDGNLLVGARGDHTSASSAGSAYLFDGNDGSLILTINNLTPEGNDYFGFSVASTPDGNILVGAHNDNTGATDAGSAYLFDGISMSTPAPIITSLIADDPDDLDDVYSVDDTITITFDSDTNEPGGTGGQGRAAINDLFTFTEPLGQGYSGQWTTADTFTITINGVNNVALVIGTTTVTPDGTTPILSADETSDASSATSPVLSGDFGILAFSNPWMDGDGGVIYYDGGNVGIGTSNPNSKLEVTNGYFELDTSSGIPPAEDCDNTDEIGRMKVDDSTTDLYICTSSGWVTK